MAIAIAMVAPLEPDAKATSPAPLSGLAAGVNSRFIRRFLPLVVKLRGG